MMRMFILACVVGINALAAASLEVRVLSEGQLAIPGGEISLDAFSAGWKGARIRTEYSTDNTVERHLSDDVIHKFKILAANNDVLFTGQYEWSERNNGSIVGKVSIECVSACNMQCVAPSAKIPSSPPSGLGRGTVSRYELPIEGGQALCLEFPSKTSFQAQDSRRWGGRWTVRFGNRMDQHAFVPGERVEWNFTITSSCGAALDLVPMRPVTIKRDCGWAVLENRKDVGAGTALDFSNMGLQDAPAGKYGWLKAVGGHFEFEKLPGVEQRFYGVNLCFGANYLSKVDAEMIVDRFVRCGYNTIRIHHHDGDWYASSENRDRLDYLIAKAIEKGIYITTDLYVSRPVKWRSVGIDRDGVMEKSLYKTYIGISDAAFKDWAEHSKMFLDHVNPYTKRAYKDEPGMPLISLVNEGRISMTWKRAGKASDPAIKAAWKEFGGKGALPAPYSSEFSSPINRFDEWVNSRIWVKGSAYVRSLGSRALLTNDNNGRWHSEGEGLTPLYDYVDNHFYIDHPEFIDTPWKLPSRCSNANPIRTGEPSLFNHGWGKGCSKPYTITEWNFSGPGRYRAMGGILTGAYAAEQEWDGLWRFCYSHSSKNIKGRIGRPGYFDCVTDPLIAASDRASVCLYLRRDAHEGSLKINKKTGSMSLVSPRTCGGFVEGGSLDVGSLSFVVKPIGPDGGIVPTTLWVSSLDGLPLAQSTRMILVHLTDVQGDGRLYADEKRKILLKWGKGCLVELGAAEVSMKLDAPSEYKVFGLDTSGKRVCQIETRTEKNKLCFSVSTSSHSGGRIYYEVVR